MKLSECTQGRVVILEGTNLNEDGFDIGHIEKFDGNGFAGKITVVVRWAHAGISNENPQNLIPYQE